MLLNEGQSWSESNSTAQLQESVGSWLCCHVLLFVFVGSSHESVKRWY